MRRITFLFLLASFCIHAEPPPDQWYTVLLDGRKIGSFESTREILLLVFRHRLVKDITSYEKEKTKQQARIEKLVSENAEELKLRQEVTRMNGSCFYKFR